MWMWTLLLDSCVLAAVCHCISLTYHMPSQLKVYRPISSCPDLSVRSIAQILLSTNNPRGSECDCDDPAEPQLLGHNIMIVPVQRRSVKGSLCPRSWWPCDVCSSPRCEIVNVSSSVRSYGRHIFHGSPGRNVILWLSWVLVNSNGLIGVLPGWTDREINKREAGKKKPHFIQSSHLMLLPCLFAGAQWGSGGHDVPHHHPDQRGPGKIQSSTHHHPHRQRLRQHRHQGCRRAGYELSKQSRAVMRMGRKWLTLWHTLWLYLILHLLLSIYPADMHIFFGN